MPPSDILWKPAIHVQLKELMLLAGAFEFIGHCKQDADPAKEYVSLGHS